MATGSTRARSPGDWSIVRGANGGHLAAMLLGGMQLAIDDTQREPRTLTVHFLRVPKNEAVTVRTQIERTGRTMSTITAKMEQDGKPIAVGLAGFSTERQGPDFSDLAMPEVPSPDTIEGVMDRPDFPFGRQFDFRRAIGHPDERSDRAELGIWIRLREPQVVDHTVATQLMDAFAPAVFAKLGTGGGGAGVPTIEMTYHYRESLPMKDAQPGEWNLGVFRTMTSSGGFIEEDGWLWNQNGTLLAQSRQLALITS